MTNKKMGSKKSSKTVVSNNDENVAIAVAAPVINMPATPMAQGNELSVTPAGIVGFSLDFAQQSC